MNKDIKKVYILQHSYECGPDKMYDETKFIGVYSNLKYAKYVVDKLKDKNGFNKYPIDCFVIDEYDVNKTHWEEGFITWEEAMNED